MQLARRQATLGVLVTTSHLSIIFSPTCSSVGSPSSTPLHSSPLLSSLSPSLHPSQSANPAGKIPYGIFAVHSFDLLTYSAYLSHHHSIICVVFPSSRYVAIVPRDRPFPILPWPHSDLTESTLPIVLAYRPPQQHHAQVDLRFRLVVELNLNSTSLHLLPLPLHTDTNISARSYMLTRAPFSIKHCMPL